ncbi:hypothetical protein CAPTEDRAFT_175080 [Capitella teleta]|uniref:Transmembrane protein 33 n=1 Tax=Capitella teleta TaxID=283909 RepID=R7TX74_CAPTE|nr:hypothetical protein CAPTEDRAFT_175080 [Capitella teleta]|eukprot:ELT96051.1 hypothetical protein CAPTEDRAFT_175080 [Capitella teleta]
MSSDGSSTPPPPPPEGSAPPPPEGSPPPEGAMNRIIALMSQDKISAGLWITRMITIISTCNFFLPILGGNPISWFQRALVSSAATSALRLHQRLPNFQLSREFFGRLLSEDSAHYLFYCMIFVTNTAITMTLVPVFLFAVLHTQSYTKKLLDAVGPNSLMIIRNLLNKLAFHQVSLLRFIACNEIFLMPAIFFMIFMGQSSLLMPFIYYRFLTLRYASHRNPYCRQLFYELRMTTEQLVMNARCPEAVRSISHKAIAFISRLAPPVQPQPQ